MPTYPPAVKWVPVPSTPAMDSLACGDVVPIPILQLLVSKVRKGAAVVEVAKEYAFTATGSVVVDELV